MTLRLAISPCPNDTFAFEPLLHERVETDGLKFDLVLADIAELNAIARLGTADVVKLSTFAYAQLRHHYHLLNAGSALGHGVGPLLVSPNPLADLAQARIAIPGWDTTAHLLLHHYAPQAQHRSVRVFHEIMPAVAAGEYDAGVIIHESRFTYARHGLQVVADLGAHWEQTTGGPIPLGAIAVHRRHSAALANQVDRVLARSVAFALANPAAPLPFVRQHAQEMNDEVMQAHIALYVNEHTLALGPDGHRAVATLLSVADAMGSLHPVL